MPAERGYTTTEQELLGVIRALQEWRCYVEGGTFPVTLVTDHNPLTFLRSQTTLSRRQARWVEFLERFHYEWKYIPGHTNVADPLSRIPPLFMALTAAEHTDTTEPTPSICTQIQMGYCEDLWFSNTKNTQHLTLDSMGLYRLGVRKPSARIVVPDILTVKLAILRHMHDNIAAGHTGPRRTIELVSRWFWWKGMANFVADYCTRCKSCQQMKPISVCHGGLLKPLPIPTFPWESISTGFITCLPVAAKGNDMLIVWVDRLTKYVVLQPSVLTLSAEGFAQHTVDHVIAKHGMPVNFVSDRDVRFTSNFWRTLNASLGTQLCMSTAFHPQTDGQTERMNRLIEETLRHYVSFAQNDWDKNIQLVAFAINNARNESIQNTPFFLNKGIHPRMPCGISDFPTALEMNPKTVAFTESMTEALSNAKRCMANAQSNQKQQADKKRRDVTFLKGETVLLCTKNLKIKGDNCTFKRQKLLPRFIGPYTITEQVGEYAMRLSLPVDTRIQPVFRVSMLKHYKNPVDDPLARPIAQPLDWLEGNPEFFIDHIVSHRIVKQGKRSLVQYLLRWSSFNEDHDSYEPRGTVPPGTHNIFDDYDTLHQLHHFHKPVATTTAAKQRTVTVLPTTVLPATAQPLPVLPPTFTVPASPQSPLTGVVHRSKRKRIPNRRFE